MLVRTPFHRASQADRRLILVGHFNRGGYEALAPHGWCIHVGLHVLPRQPSLHLTTQPSWEFLTTLDHEWDVIRGHRPYRWTIWVCFLL
jgi:hypothetical protein